MTRGTDILIDVSAKRAEKHVRLMSRLTGTVSALVMIVAAIVALILTNVGFHEPIHHAMETPLGFYVGETFVGLTFEQVVNDLLMAFFFLLVGCELKYEMTVGALAKPKQAILPMVAALGGVCGPALIYLAINMGGDAVQGWAIPTATDIAFALAVMSLFGERIPVGVKVFFSTLAIADDMVAIVVIALFYGQSPDVAWCAASGIVIVVLWGLNHARVYSLKPYALVGLVLWFCMYNSGIHATLAGVILAFALPSKSDVRLSDLSDWLQNRAQDLDEVYDEGLHVLGQNGFTHTAMRVERVMHHVTPPLQRMEHYISTPVNFLILPLFAFVNAQLRLVGADFGAIVMDPVTRGVFFGAVLGKPLGIISVTLLLVKIGFAKLPKNMDWVQVAAVGIMGGMGFTMSILIAGLAFPNPAEVMAAKCAILAGSFTAGALGVLFVRVHDAIAGRRPSE